MTICHFSYRSAMAELKFGPASADRLDCVPNCDEQA